MERGLYDKLPLSHPTYIRLLRISRVEGQHIECTLEVADLRHDPQYCALSYTWGPPTEEAKRNGMTAERSKFIICNGRIEPVTENLFQFLLFVGVRGRAGEEPKSIWIDAICINQDDQHERSQEVLKIARIYSSATHTLAWLGNADQYTNDAVELITAIAKANCEKFRSLPLDLRCMSRLLEREVTQEHIDAMMSYFGRTYFSRVWIFQEVVASRVCIVFCGHLGLVMETLEVASKNITESRWKYALEATHAGSMRSEERMPSIGIPYLLSQMKTLVDKHKTVSLEVLLLFTRAFKATLKHDKVYALLGMSRDQITVDYDRSPAYTFILAAYVLLETAMDLSFLSFDDNQNTGRDIALPTWVPDFDTSHHGLIRLNPVGFRAAGNVRQRHSGIQVIGAGPSHPFIMLKGVLLDVIVEVGPPSRREGDSELTRAHSWTAFETWLSVLDHLDQVYINGQDRVEVFWRTICMDCDLGATDALRPSGPAPQSLRDAFRSCILYQAAVALREGDLRDKSKLKVLDRFSSENSNIPTSSEVLKIHRADNSQELTDKLWLSAMNFDSAFTRSGHNICRTIRGLLGRCPMAAVQGDQIWVIPSCPVPLVLRNVAKVGRYRLIGDSYVHGFMQGEALKQNPAIADVEIE